MISFKNVKPKMPYSRKVLIVKLSALGDILHALPVLTHLRRTSPFLEIHWAVDASFAELLEGHPGGVKVVPIPLREWKRRVFSRQTWKEALDAICSLRRERYDIVIDIQGNLKSGLVTRLSGAPLRIGFDWNGVREVPNLLFTNRKARLLPDDRHVSRKYLRVASSLFEESFEPSDFFPVLSVSAGDRDAAALLVDELLKDFAIRMVVHPGTSWPTKKAPEGFWVGVIRLLREQTPAIGVLLSWGSEEERQEALEIRKMAGEGVELLPSLSLALLAAVYQKCGFVMAPDTGPLHLAAAVGAATVSVFRATDGLRNAPEGPSHRFIQVPVKCAACLRKECVRDQICRNSISSIEAAELMAGLMDAKGTGNK
ncbi:MAG: lipopolysaccharide heptosyltransferase I [Syntrophorhabdaceae bacterium]|nr:lipopolysaccharide heptosyltransferase I [Syntrophorhabdaceae bacterium]